MREEYDAAFVAFLLFTNEKEELYAEIAQRIGETGAKSLLDIGAGPGELAVPLASLVGRYCAVEQKDTYTALLKAAGLRVVECSFPAAIDDLPFDLVLISHALPREPLEYEAFLQSAWRCVAPGGFLLGITYDDVQSEWWDFLATCNLARSERDLSRIEKLLMHFSTLGPTTLNTVTTTVSTASKRGIVSALSFVYSDGRKEKMQEFEDHAPVILEYLDARYRNGEEYCFPFHHIFLQAYKGA